MSQSKASQSKGPKKSAATKQIVMLSIDEQTMTSELDRAGYRKMGVTVRKATTWAAANKILSAETVDVIVVNLDVPTFDGFDLLKQFRHSEWKEVALVATSVQTTPKVRTQATKFGADLFVEQPVPRDYFIEKVKALLDQQTRSTQRVNAEIDVRFKYGSKEHHCGVGDLSITGVLLSTDIDIPHGELIDVSFLLGASTKPVVVKAEVVRRIDGNKQRTAEGLTGIGARFVQFLGDAEQRLESYIARTSDKTNKMVYYL